MAELWEVNHPAGEDFEIAFDAYSTDGQGLSLEEFALVLDHEPFASIMPEAIERTGDTDCSPYTVLTLGTEQQHTAAGTGWDHVWGEVFSFDLYDEDDILGVAVFGKARLHPLGSTHIALAEITAIERGQEMHKCMPLAGSEAGELELTVTWSPEQGGRGPSMGGLEASPPRGSKTRSRSRSKSPSERDRAYLAKRPF